MLDASGIVTKGELEYLNKNKTVIESISGDLQDVPDIAASHLSEIEDFKKIVESNSGNHWIYN